MLALADDEGVVRRVFVEDVPRFFTRPGDAADAQPLALADGVVHQADVFADPHALRGNHFAGLVFEVVGEEVAEGALADEADAGGVFFVVGNKSRVFGDAAHGAFCHAAQREQRFVELRRGDLAQKVALVFAAVHAFVERGRALVRAAPRVVAGGEVVRAEFCGVVRHFGKFDFAVAEDVRVGGASGAVFGEEVAEDALVVFGDEVHGVQRDAEGFANIARVFDVFFGAAIAAAVGFFPVFHEDAEDVVTGIAQEEGGDGGIDAAGDADGDFGALRRGVWGHGVS